jgi:hypothetical protein
MASEERPLQEDLERRILEAFFSDQWFESPRKVN